MVARARGTRGTRGLSPQEKKRLTYTRDRRNEYGENDKSSRRNVPRSKRAPHRANRHRAHLVLGTLAGAAVPDDSEAGDVVEARLKARKPKVWRKRADTPLADALIWRLERRVALGTDDAARSAARVRTVRRRVRGRSPRRVAQRLGRQS